MLKGINEVFFQTPQPERPIRVYALANLRKYTRRGWSGSFGTPAMPCPSGQVITLLWWLGQHWLKRDTLRQCREIYWPRGEKFVTLSGFRRVINLEKCSIGF